MQPTIGIVPRFARLARDKRRPCHHQHSTPHPGEYQKAALPRGSRLQRACHRASRPICETLEAFARESIRRWL
jgi:hypothetical protein